MNTEIVNQLAQLEIDYKLNGQTRNILYRIAMLPFFFIEKTNRDVEAIHAYRQLFCINAEHQCDLIESLIELYSTDGKLYGMMPTIYSNYSDVLEEYVKYLLGKENWIPSDERAHAEANDVANKFTAAVLTDIYSK